MRAGPAMRVTSVSADAFTSLRLRWLQAGLSSSAYRLAHLRVARPALLGTISFLFFLV
jgi:hypothetical protein